MIITNDLAIKFHDNKFISRIRRSSVLFILSIVEREKKK